MIKIQPKVSVCVPIYKSEEFLEQCIRSLFEQTLDDMEYVFVNDCTPDKSVNILFKTLEDYPLRKSQVKIINHKRNQGFIGAYRTVFTNATGEYVIACDADDWVEPDMYEKLYNKAYQTDADVVCCDHYLERPQYRSFITSHFEGDKSKRMAAFVSREYKSYQWVMLVKASINRKLEYIEGTAHMGDCIRACQVLHFAEKYEYIAEPLYHYRYYGYGYSSNVQIDHSIKAHIIGYEWIFDFMHREYSNLYEKEMRIAMLKIKIDWCKLGLRPEFYTQWPEANDVSLLNNMKLSKSIRVLLWLAIRKWTFVFNTIVKTYQFIRN